MNRDGKADIGVSICEASLFAACGFVVIGGAGRAKGLGGPCAPALSKAFADGDGGGNTTPCDGPACCEEPLIPLGLEVLGASELAVPPSSPECSLGICTLRRGRLASDELVFVLAGTGTPAFCFCFGCGVPLVGLAVGSGLGDTRSGLTSSFAFSRCMDATSTDAARAVASTFSEGSAELVEPQC